MSRIIYTYENLWQIKTCSFYQEIKSLPQIADCRELKQALNSQTQLFSLRVTDISEYRKELIPEWYDDHTIFHLSILIATRLRSRLRQAKDNDEKAWLLGCRKSLSSILSALRTLEEVSLTKEKLSTVDSLSMTRDMELLLDIREYILKQSDVLQRFRRNVEALAKPGRLEKVIKKCNKGNKSYKQIVLHNFYYITPIEERWFQIMERQGYQLIFLIEYKQAYPYAYEVYKPVFVNSKRYTIKARQFVKKADSNLLGEIMEGRIPSQAFSHIQIQRYDSVSEFADGMKDARDRGYNLYSCDRDRANDILKDFFPEEYEARDLLSYPIGQYIYRLNRMWDEESGRIVLDGDSLRECFASGWLAVGDLNSRDYTQDLEYILPYFEDCRTLQDWRQRLVRLTSVQKNVVSPFKTRMNSHVDGDRLRWHQICGNPFQNFSMFALPAERMETLFDLLSGLLDMAEMLYGDDQQVILSQHMKKLQELLDKNRPASELYKEEKQIVSQLFDRISQAQVSELRCFPSDISEALTLYLSGGLEVDDGRDEKFQKMVRPLQNMVYEGPTLEKNIHLCLCDITSSPGAVNDYPWPLDKIFLDHYRDQHPNDYVLKAYMNYWECQMLSNRFLIYKAFTAENLTLSWLYKDGVKEIAPSPYIKLLSEFAEIPIKKAGDDFLDFEMIKTIPGAKPQLESYTFDIQRNGAVKEAAIDYAVCPMRYIYGYVLEEFPAYQTTFLQNYAVNGLVAAIYGLLKSSKGKKRYKLEKILQETLALFPNLRNAEKRQIMDYLSLHSGEADRQYDIMSTYDGISYTEERLKIKFPDWEFREIALERYSNLYSGSGTEGIDLYTETRTKKACVFCQHAHYCRNAVYALDQEAVYE